MIKIYLTNIKVTIALCLVGVVCELNANIDSLFIPKDAVPVFEPRLSDYTQSTLKEAKNLAWFDKVSLGGYIQGVSADLEIQAEQTRRVKEIGAGILAKNCGKTVEQIMRDFDRDYWMDAKQSIEYGIADQLIDKL